MEDLLLLKQASPAEWAPARLPGAADRVTHRIADIVFRTVSTETLPGLRNPPYAHFEAEADTADVYQFIQRIHPETPPPLLTGTQQQVLASRPSFHPNWIKNPILCSEPVQRRLATSVEASGQDVDLTVDDHHVAIRDFPRRRFHLFYTPTSGGYIPACGGYLPEHYVKANLTQIFAAFLPRFDAFLLHSAGLVMGDKAVLFLAPDEGGKSTVVGTARGHTLLGEDQIMLRRGEGGRVEAHSTPFGGPCAGSLGAEVKAVFLLQKAAGFHIRGASARDVIPYVWAEHQNLIFPLPKPLKARAFELLSRTCAQAVLRTLAFPREHVDWKAIEQVVEGHDVG